MLKQLIILIMEWLSRVFKISEKPIPDIEEVIVEEAIKEEIKTIKVSRIYDWAKAIEKYEGYYPQSRSYRNNNPGNIKSLDGSFLTFKSYQEGFDYLCDYLKRVCEGKHTGYSKGGETTLLEFFIIYAPQADNNYPIAYAQFVAIKLGVDESIKIKEFL